MSRPARSTLPAVCAWECASGSQPCSGTAGSFTAKATKKPSISQKPVARGQAGAEELQVVEGVDAGRAPVDEVQPHDGDEHQQPAGLRVDEELDGRPRRCSCPQRTMRKKNGTSIISKKK